MDPVLKSTLTSIGLAGATALSATAASHGVIPNDAGSQASLANALLVVGGAAVAAVLAWYKTRDHTPTAQIEAVKKADNGVTPVATADAKAAGIPAVSAPVK